MSEIRVVHVTKKNDSGCCGCIILVLAVIGAVAVMQWIF